MINKLEICGLTKRFGEKTLFEDLDLTLAEPAILWAPSGWGKTTLLRILMGLEVPDSGTVQGVGRVGAVFQEDRLCPQLTAVQNVELVLPEGKTQYKTQIVSDFQRFGYDEQALALPARKLSGGQKRRVAIAGVIAMEPEVLILDEPTAGLDPVGREEILGNIRAYRAAKNAAVLMVSHSMEDVARLTDRLLVMNGSRLAMDAAPGEVFEHVQELLDMGLSIPKVTQVFLRLRSLGVDVKNVYTIDQAVAELLRLKEGKGVC